MDHYMKAMEGMLTKYGAYMKHIENVIAEEKEKTCEATVQGKNGNCQKQLFCVTFFTDILQPAKIFTLMYQKKDINIPTITGRHSSGLCQ